MYAQCLANSSSPNGKAKLLLFPDFKQPVCTLSYGEIESKEFFGEKELHVVECSTTYPDQTKSISRVKFFSDQPIQIEGNTIHASKNATWFLEKWVELGQFIILALPKTHQIVTPYGPKYDITFNKLLRTARAQYFTNKYEPRLYFFNAQNHQLEICSNSPYEAKVYFIDKEYKWPNITSFIIGRIKRSSGSKDGSLQEYIEPIYTIPLHFHEDIEWYQYDNVNEWYRSLKHRLHILWDYHENEQLSHQIRDAFQNSDLAKLRSIYYKLVNSHQV